MIVFAEHLAEAIRALPDPETYSYTEYRAVIMKPVEITTYNPKITERQPYITVPFRKNTLTNGKKVWTISIPDDWIGY